MCSIPGLPLPGTNVSVLITRINSNPLCVLVEFWGNFDQDRRPEYQQMKKKIQYPREVFNEAEGNPGDLCLVQVYETWNRARIVSKNDTDYTVFLIDEGRTICCTTSTLAWGPTDFFCLPPEVEFCVLSDLLPLSPAKKWSEMAMKFLKTFIGKAVSACVQDVLVPQRTFLLDIPCISRQMCEMGFAKKLSNEEFRDFVSRSLQSHSGFVKPLMFTSVINDPIKPTESQQYYMYPELQTETVETVVVTEVINPLRVFCQLKVFSQELKKLTEQITLHYEGRSGTHFARPENLGVPCASRGSDGRWYRSVLQQVVSSNMVEVLHVDCGKKQFVSVEHVRPLAFEFIRMPVVTYVCSLHGVVDKGIGWTASQIDYLKNLLLNRTVIARFEYQSLSEGVHYVTLYGDENTNINSIFGLRAMCLMDSKSHKDTLASTVPSTFQKPQVSLKGETTGYDTSENMKSNTPIFFTESLKPNTSHVAVVQHVESPSKFWIQTKRYAVEFDQLTKDLEELYCDPTSLNGLIKRPVPGLLCVAKSQDNVFYRAVVCDVIEAKAEVFFLDYGNREIVDCFNLRELPFRYQKLPALAVKCALYGVQPRCKQWDQMAILFFSKTVQDKVLNVHVLSKSQDTHFVQVFDSLSNEESDLSELLCSAGFADCETKKNAVDNPALKPEVNQTSGKVKSHAPSQSSIFPAVTAAFKEYLFPIGSSLDVVVSYIESPNDFWCQKANNKECLKFLMQDLQNYYTSSEYQPPLEAACVARHPQNGMWYRALVIQKHQTPHVTVLFIDYGETKKVAIPDLRHINPTFLKLKGQAFRCSLFNFHADSQSTLEWSPDATVLFQEFLDNAATMNTVLKCTVYAVMYDSHKVLYNVVDLETPFQSICRLLIQRGLVEQASTKKSHLPPLRMDTYYYSTHSIKTGSEEDVSITSVDDVNHFFCHLGRNSLQVERLAKQVNNLCRQLEKIDCPKTFGKVCFAKYTDGLWYRGLIQSAQRSIVVHFVDYGNTEEVDKADLLPVPIEAGEIMSVPLQAIVCGLSDMPEEVPSEVNNWFKSFVTDRCLKALVVAKETSGKLIVELYDGKTQLNAVVKEKFHSDVKRNELVTVKGSHVMDQDWPCNVFESPKDCENQLHEFKRQKESQKPLEPWRCLKSAGSRPTVTSKKSYNGVVKRDMSQKSSACDALYREPHTKFKHVNSAFSKPSDFKLEEIHVKAINSGLEAEIFVSHCNSPLSFFVQFVTDESDICSLVEKLNDVQSKCVPIKPSDLHEGDLVSAVFPDDDCWYRAVVIKASSSDMINVEFIDFGNTAEVSVSKICVLDRMFSQPRYSIHCSLTGVLNTDSEVTSNFKEEIEKNNRMTCTFIQQSGSIWEVKLDIRCELLVSLFSKDATVTITDGLVSPGAPVTEQELFNNHLTCCENPAISNGQAIAVYASFISGPQLFWCQFAEADQLQEISDIIQKAANDSETRALQEDTIPVGSDCIALYDEDQLWYRAKVTSREHGALSVLFVDYGNESKVKVSDVRSLPPEVADVPPQAFACQLDGFDVSAGSWNDKATDKFFELINDKILKVTVLKLGNLDDPQACHFVRLECDDLVINDAMEACFTSKSPGLAKISDVTSFDNKPEASCCDSEPVRSKELQVTTKYQHSVAVSTIKMQNYDFEREGTKTEHDEQSRSVEKFDESGDLVSFASSQEEDQELKTVKLVAEDLLFSKERSQVSKTSASNKNPGGFWEKAILKDLDMNADFCTDQPDNLLKDSSLQATDLNHEPFADTQCLPQDPENRQISSSFESDCTKLDNPDEKLIKTVSGKDQPNNDFSENVFDCTSFVSEHKTHEINKPGFVSLKNATKKNSVGLECVVWSTAVKNWCRAKIIKISDDSTLVLLLDYDSLMMVDPANLFEIVPEESLQVLGGVRTDLPKGASGGTSAEFTTAGLKDEGVDEKAVDCFASLDFSGPDDEMLEQTSGMYLLNTEEEPQDKAFDSASDDLGVLSDQPKLGIDPVLDVQQTLTPVLAFKEQTIDTVATVSSAEEQRDYGPKICQKEEELNLLSAIILEKAQDVEPEAKTKLDMLDVIQLEKDHNLEPNVDTMIDVTKDLIDLGSDDKQESDTSSDETVKHGPEGSDHLSVSGASGSHASPSYCDRPDPEESPLSRVTHLTIKIEDPADEVVFVKAWQVFSTETSGPGSEE